MCLSIEQDALLSDEKDTRQSNFTNPHTHRCSSPLALKTCEKCQLHHEVPFFKKLKYFLPLTHCASKSTTHKVLVTASSCFPMWSPQWAKEEQRESWPLLSYTSKTASSPPLAFVWPSDLALVCWMVGPHFFIFCFLPQCTCREIPPRQFEVTHPPYSRLPLLPSN